MTMEIRYAKDEQSEYVLDDPDTTLAVRFDTVDYGHQYWKLMKNGEEVALIAVHDHEVVDDPDIRSIYEEDN